MNHHRPGGLTQHSEIDACDITVEVGNGEVVLTGTVPDRRSKRLAGPMSPDTI
jgi:osmotically-inducible protein OsmY